MSECTCGQWIDPTCPIHKLTAEVPPVDAASEESFRDRLRRIREDMGTFTAEQRSALEEMLANYLSGSELSALRSQVRALEEERDAAYNAGVSTGKEIGPGAYDYKALRAENASLKAEVERLKECLEPGKASAIIDAMFREAARLGFYEPTGKHALTQFVEEVEKLRAKLETAIAFKQYVHTRLDDAGIPQGDPENQHQKEGCRIGARLDMVFAKLEAAERERDELKFSPGATKVGVMAVIKNAGLVLLGKKARAVSQEFVGKFVAPGGRVNYGEPLEDACIRECREETGLEIRIVRQLPTQEIIAEKWHFVFATFECEVIGGSESAGDDLCELLWCEPDNLPQVTPITRAAIISATERDSLRQQLAASEQIIAELRHIIDHQAPPSI